MNRYLKKKLSTALMSPFYITLRQGILGKQVKFSLGFRIVVCVLILIVYLELLFVST